MSRVSLHAINELPIPSIVNLHAKERKKLATKMLVFNIRRLDSSHAASRRYNGDYPETRFERLGLIRQRLDFLFSVQALYSNYDGKISQAKTLLSPCHPLSEVSYPYPQSSEKCRSILPPSCVPTSLNRHRWRHFLCSPTFSVGGDGRACVAPSVQPLLRPIEPMC